MARSTSLILCVFALLLVSSAANAALVWTDALAIGGPLGSTLPGSGNIPIPQYDPDMYGGAELQAVRWDLRLEVSGIDWGVLNFSNTQTEGLATVNSSFEIFDPTTPNPVIVGVQNNWSQWLSVAPYTVTTGSAPGSVASAVGILTTNLEPFVGHIYQPVNFGYAYTSYSSWTESATSQFIPQFDGNLNIDIYYGYDDGTPARTPEPGTLLMFAAGLPALGFIRRRRRTATAG